MAEPRTGAGMGPPTGRRPEPEVEASTARAQALWSGTLSFGLVNIQVYLYPANRRGGVSLRMLGPGGVPLARRYYCPADGREVRPDEIVRGFEVGPEEYVVVESEELDALAPERSREIDLRRFVPAGSIPPLYFERAYFLTPAGETTKAYRLLARTMERTGRAGVATFVMRGTEYLVAILSEEGILRAETLRFADEIRTPEDVGLPEPGEVDPHTVRRMAREIEARTAEDLDPDELRDQDARRLEALIRAKRERGEDVVGVPEELEPEEEDEEPADLMKVLKWSLRHAS